MKNITAASAYTIAFAIYFIILASVAHFTGIVFAFVAVTIVYTGVFAHLNELYTENNKN